MQQFGEFVVNHWDLFLALLIILALLIGGPLSRRLRGFEDVEPQAAVGLMNHQDAVFLDVREDNEYREGHAPEAMHVPLSVLGQQLDRLANLKEKPIIVGCRSGHRSSRAAGILRKNGFDRVYNLRGGMMAWENAGLPVTRGKENKKKRKTAKK